MATSNSPESSPHLSDVIKNPKIHTNIHTSNPQLKNNQSSKEHCTGISWVFRAVKSHPAYCRMTLRRSLSYVRYLQSGFHQYYHSVNSQGHAKIWTQVSRPCSEAATDAHGFQNGKKKGGEQLFMKHGRHRYTFRPLVKLSFCHFNVLMCYVAHFNQDYFLFSLL